MFKITLKKAIPKEGVKISEWVVKHIGSGRVQKTCETCNKLILKGNPATTFSKSWKVDDEKKYKTIYTCPGKCTKYMTEKLGISQS